jgi:hypothetical protein
MDVACLFAAARRADGADNNFQHKVTALAKPRRHRNKPLMNPSGHDFRLSENAKMT